MGISRKEVMYGGLMGGLGLAAGLVFVPPAAPLLLAFGAAAGADKAHDLAAENPLEPAAGME